jgi:hypothetical protein
LLAYSRSTATVTEQSSGTRYLRKNSGGTPPSKPYPLSQQLPDRGSKASKCRPTKLIPPPTSATRRQRKQSFQVSSVLPKKKFTLPIPKERRTNNDNNKIQRQTHPNPYINHNHHFPHHPQLQPNPCSSRTQRGHNPERVLPYHNPVTR